MTNHMTISPAYGGDRFMPQLNTDAVKATESVEQDPVVESIRNTFNTPANILSFNQKPKSAIAVGLAPKIMLSSSKENYI